MLRVYKSRVRLIFSLPLIYQGQKQEQMNSRKKNSCANAIKNIMFGPNDELLMIVVMFYLSIVTITIWNQ